MNTDDKLIDYSEFTNNILKNEHLYSDEELSEKIKESQSKIPYNVEIHDIQISELVKRRVKKYCENNKLDLEEYQGCLPFRLFKIPVGGLSREEAEKQIMELMKEYHEDVQWDDSIKIKIDPNKNYDQDIWYPKKTIDRNADNSNTE